MVNTTVPVMTGGNRRRMGLINTPTSVATMPPTIMAPATAASPPLPEAMACMLGKYAKLTPKITGSPAPNRPPMGNSSSSVVTADITSDAWISSTLWLWDSPTVLAMMMAGVTQPTIMDTRCCRAMDTAIPSGGTPRNRNSAASLWAVLRMVCPPLGRRGV